MSSKFTFQGRYQKITAVDGKVGHIDNRSYTSRSKPTLDVNPQTITTNANILLNILNEQSQMDHYIKFQTIEQKQKWIHDIFTNYLKQKL
eukprot:386227_1